VLPICTAIGPPNVRPCRTPPDLGLLHVTDDVDDMIRVVHDAYAAWEAAH